jgi:hypothetical protein
LSMTQPARAVKVSVEDSVRGFSCTLLPVRILEVIGHVEVVMDLGVEVRTRPFVLVSWLVGRHLVVWCAYYHVSENLDGCMLATHGERASITDVVRQAIVKSFGGSTSQKCMSLCGRPLYDPP